MDPTGSESRYSPKVVHVLALMLVGIVIFGYDNFTSPATTTTQVATAVAGTGLAQSSCNPGANPQAANLQCTAGDYTCDYPAMSPTRPGVQCMLQKDCTEPNPDGQGLISGTCACPQVCKTTSTGGIGAPSGATASLNPAGSAPDTGSGAASSPQLPPISSGASANTQPNVDGYGNDVGTQSAPPSSGEAANAGIQQNAGEETSEAAQLSSKTFTLSPELLSPDANAVVNMQAPQSSAGEFTNSLTGGLVESNTFTNVIASEPTSLLDGGIVPPTTGVDYTRGLDANYPDQFNSTWTPQGSPDALDPAVKQQVDQRGWTEMGDNELPANSELTNAPNPFTGSLTKDGRVPSDFPTEADYQAAVSGPSPADGTKVTVDSGGGIFKVQNADNSALTQDQKDYYQGIGYTCSSDTSCFKIADASKVEGPPASSGSPDGKTPPVDANGNPPPAAKAAPDTSADKSGAGSGGGSGSGSGALGALSSLLQGLMKGLSSPAAPAAAPAQACSTDPNAYAQQQTQYQQQLQNYNYQLQQYQYQQQLNSYYGNTNVAPIAPTQPTPCTPSTAQQCSQPQQPAAGSCSGGTWTPVFSNNCITNWQCSNLGANLSCSPSTADVGGTLTLNYSCAQGTASGSGFVTTDASGTATTTIAAPPAGTNTATYALTCTNGAVTSGAQCSVQITQPSIILVANPKLIATGGTSLIGWITSGMQSCTISSRQQSDFNTRNSSNTSVSGSAATSPISTSATFQLDCITIGGAIKSASTTVSVSGFSGGGSAGTIIATSTVDGTTLNHGDNVTINWNSSGESSDSAVSLWLVDVVTGDTTLIAGAQPLNGTYQWSVPATGSTCPSDAPSVCARDLVAGKQYEIEADVYTPANAWLGMGFPPADPVQPAYGDYSDGAAFTVGN